MFVFTGATVIQITYHCNLNPTFSLSPLVAQQEKGLGGREMLDLGGVHGLVGGVDVGGGFLDAVQGDLGFGEESLQLGGERDGAAHADRLIAMNGGTKDENPDDNGVSIYSAERLAEIEELGFDPAFDRAALHKLRQ